MEWEWRGSVRYEEVIEVFGIGHGASETVDG